MEPKWRGLRSRGEAQAAAKRPFALSNIRGTFLKKSPCPTWGIAVVYCSGVSESAPVLSLLKKSAQEKDPSVRPLRSASTGPTPCLMYVGCSKDHRFAALGLDEGDQGMGCVAAGHRKRWTPSADDRTCTFPNTEIGLSPSCQGPQSLPVLPASTTWKLPANVV